MSARISRLATALFAVLSAAMAINLTVMQPGARLDHVADRSGMWGAVRETAALAVPELDQRKDGRSCLPGPRLGRRRVWAGRCRRTPGH